jgi:hypothetical protein
MADRLEASGLLRPLDADEVYLLTTIHEPFAGEGRFPIFHYVDRQLFEKGLDAARLLAGLPTTGGPALYGLVRPAGGRYWRAEETVELTIAGLMQCQRAGEAVAIFLSVLELLVERERRSRMDPYEVPRVEVQSGALEQHLRRANFDVDKWTLPQLRTLLQYEPVGAASGGSGTPEQWTVQVSKDVRLYRGVTDSASYLERVVEYLTPPTAAVKRLYPSPFTLPEAIDFLDAVWLVRFGKDRLFRLGSASAITGLAFACATEDEFKSRVSALADVLARMDVPLTNGLPPDSGSLVRLEAFLATSLLSPDLDRLADLVGVLKAIVAIRAGGQHDDARRRQLDGYTKLGIAYPITGWATAWEDVQVHAIEAINAARQEIQFDTST